MKPNRLGSWFVLLISMLAASPVAAQENPLQHYGVNLSLFTPVSTARADAAVGFRLNLIYGKNTSVDWWDMGLVNRTTSHDAVITFGVINVADDVFAPFGLGFVNVAGGTLGGVVGGAVNVSEDLQGMEGALINYTKGTTVGVQAGAINYGETITALQLGAANYARAGDALQVGLVNYAGKIRGLQIGAINIIKEGGYFPMMIIANWSKK